MKLLNKPTASLSANSTPRILPRRSFLRSLGLGAALKKLIIFSSVALAMFAVSTAIARPRASASHPMMAPASHGMMAPGMASRRFHNGNRDFDDRRFHHRRFHRFNDFVFFGFGSPFFYPYPYYDYYPYGYYEPPVYQGYSGGVSVIVQVQRRLASAGYYRGAIDGVIGSGTRRAIRSYERSHGLPVDGALSERFLATMRLG
jgi:Putative peptidoglycan binding domain